MTKKRPYYLDRIVRTAHRYIWDSPEAMQYLEQRGVTEEQIQHFEIGYIPEDKWPPYIDEKKDPGVTEDEKHYWAKSYKGALLKGKLIFPITNALGMVSAIQARSPKNDKKDYWKFYSLRAGIDALFFGTKGAMQSIWDKGEVVLVEGIFDIFPVQRVFPNTLCVGTAHLEEKQVKFLKRYVHTVNIMFDNDRQGRSFFSKFYNEHRRDFDHIQQITYAGKDPSESWRRLGEEKFQGQFGLIKEMNPLQKGQEYSKPMFEA